MNFNLYPECKYSGPFHIFLKGNDCTSELNRKEMVLFVCLFHFGVGFGFFFLEIFGIDYVDPTSASYYSINRARPGMQ